MRTRKTSTRTKRKSDMMRTRTTRRRKRRRATTMSSLFDVLQPTLNEGVSREPTKWLFAASNVAGASMRYTLIPLLLLLALSAMALRLFAQTRQDPYVRYPAPAKSQAAIMNLTGEVVSAQGAKLSQAVVHLKDKKTLEVKTRIADADGKFVFKGL